MNVKQAIQLQCALMTLTELQEHEQNPDKYEVYESSIQKLKSLIATSKGSQAVVEIKYPLGPLGSPRGDPRKSSGSVGAFDFAPIP